MIRASFDNFRLASAADSLFAGGRNVNVMMPERLDDTYSHGDWYAAALSGEHDLEGGFALRRSSTGSSRETLGMNVLHRPAGVRCNVERHIQHRSRSTGIEVPACLTMREERS